MGVSAPSSVNNYVKSQVLPSSSSWLAGANLSICHLELHLSTMAFLGPHIPIASLQPSKPPLSCKNGKNGFHSKVVNYPRVSIFYGDIFGMIYSPVKIIFQTENHGAFHIFLVCLPYTSCDRCSTISMDDGGFIHGYTILLLFFPFLSMYHPFIIHLSMFFFPFLSIYHPFIIHWSIFLGQNWVILPIGTGGNFTIWGRGASWGPPRSHAAKL